MTENEAIKEFEERLAIEDYKKDIPEYYEAMGLAVSALKEIQKYKTLGTVMQIKDLKKSEKRAHKIAIEHAMKLEEYESLGTVEALREAMEKQRKKKPFVQRTDEKTSYKCPCCKKGFVEAYENLQRGYIPKYCEMCGQSIKL